MYIKTFQLENILYFPIYQFKEKAQGLHAQYKHPPTLLCSSDKAFNLLKNIEIRQEDINELERFNPLINWEEEYDIEVGNKWLFRPHQFRRSLVVYAIRSGMIQLAVLKTVATSVSRYDDLLW